MSEWLSKESNRAYVYRVLVAAVPVLVAAGIVTEQEAAQWLGLAAAVLGIGLAVKNTSTKP